jgi:hypothetical protein
VLVRRSTQGEGLMSIEPWEQSPAEMETEFAALPDEVKLAALEYARGAQERPVAEEQADMDSEPQFILVGAQQHGQSILFASTSVKATKFARRVEGVDRVEIAPGRFARLPRMAILVAAQLYSFEQIVGGDYREGLQTLLSEWDRKARAAADPARQVQLRELPPPDRI